MPCTQVPLPICVVNRRCLTRGSQLPRSPQHPPSAPRPNSGLPVCPQTTPAIALRLRPLHPRPPQTPPPGSSGRATRCPPAQPARRTYRCEAGPPLGGGGLSGCRGEAVCVSGKGTHRPWGISGSNATGLLFYSEDTQGEVRWGGWVGSGPVPPREAQARRPGMGLGVKDRSFLANQEIRKIEESNVRFIYVSSSALSQRISLADASAGQPTGMP